MHLSILTKKIVTQEGENGTERRKDRVSYLGGEEIARESLEQVVLEEAVDEQVTVGTLVRPTGEEPGVASGISRGRRRRFGR